MVFAKKWHVNSVLSVVVAGLMSFTLTIINSMASAAEVHGLAMSDTAVIEKDEPFTMENTNTMFIQVQANGKTTVFRLNDSPAAKALYDQLPLTIDVEDYASKEKTFYPPKKLDTSDAPKANAQAGTLAYYSPWGDVVMFYEKFGSASGLYQLGEATTGNEYIKGMSGTVKIVKRTEK